MIKSVCQSWSNSSLATVFWTLQSVFPSTEAKEMPINVVQIHMYRNPRFVHANGKLQRWIDWILSWYPTSIFFQVLILFLLSKKLSISKLFFSFFPDLPYWQNFGGCYPFFCVSTTSFFLLKDVDLLPWRRNWQRAKERLQKNRIPFAYKYILLFLQLRIVKIQLRPTLMEWRGTLCISFVFCNLVVSKSFEHVLDTDIADMLQYYYFLLPSGQSAKKIVHSSF